MEIFENVNTIVSIIAGLLSILMFILSSKERRKCTQIKNFIEQKIQVVSKESTIKSKDEFNIKQVETFDNRKTIS
ncbi:hypothetical protein EHE19_019335 [Ruminiclostridium herbifermentans]|uniref:Uncharacterized protein n=1 Tax=Ruminiclostridium herbifermentans TaxID=2488810 RepID=A0A4V6EMZ3_9FIRM|nr:hypothetical protein [Ruminiclostridium herbifermentans]QNU66949.1 hypothetical protein EHE19_019335 [Ruminiclostridium herbifermentans]